MEKVQLAIIAALDDEIRVVKSKMVVDVKIHIRPSMFTLGEYLGRHILLVRSGIGYGSMKKACEYMLGHYETSSILHVGYCGGCDPRFIAGDIVIADRVVNERTGDVVEISNKNVSRASEICKSAGIRGRIGSIATVSNPAGSPHEKAYLGTKHDVACIDMESAALAEILSKAGVDFTIARSILDPLDLLLPDFGEVIDRSGHINGMSMAENMVRKPKDLLKIPKLGYLAMQARQSITSFIETWLENI